MSSNTDDIEVLYGGLSGSGVIVFSIEEAIMIQNGYVEFIKNKLAYKLEVSVDCSFDFDNDSAPTTGSLWLYKIATSMRGQQKSAIRYAHREVQTVAQATQALAIQTAIGQRVSAGFSIGMVNGLEGIGFANLFDRTILNFVAQVRVVPKPITRFERR